MKWATVEIKVKTTTVGATCEALIAIGQLLKQMREWDYGDPKTTGKFGGEKLEP